MGTRRERRIGAAAGAAVPAVVAGAATAADRLVASTTRGQPDGTLWLIAFTAACGIPVGALLGAVAGPRAAGARSTGDAVALAFGLACAAVAIGAVEVATILVFTDWPSGSATTAGVGLPLGILGLALLGIVFLGLPALLVVVPVAIAWALVVRLIARGEAAEDATV